MSSAVQRILPKSIADSVVQEGSRLAHLYGLPKTHKKKLGMRPILSATGTYNYQLAKWLDEKLKPLSVNEHTVSDIFVFADELREMKIKDREVLVWYDVSSLFTNVPVDETIESITERAFENDWFNREHDLRKKIPTSGILMDLIHAWGGGGGGRIINGMSHDIIIIIF